MDMIAILFISNPPESESLLTITVLDKESDINQPLIEEYKEGMRIKEALKQKIFYFIWYIVAMACFGVTVNSTFWKVFFKYF